MLGDIKCWGLNVGFEYAKPAKPFAKLLAHMLLLLMQLNICFDGAKLLFNSFGCRYAKIYTEYLATLLNSLVLSDFLAESLGLSMYIIMLYTENNSSTLCPI